MKHYKAIFLDWDDTIGDWSTAERKALHDIYRQYHLNDLYASADDFIAAYTPYNLSLWAKYGRGEVTKAYLHRQRFLHTLEPVCATEFRSRSKGDLALEMGDEFLRLTNRYFSLLPDAAEVVGALALKYPLTIISNGFKELQYYKFEHSGLRKFFAHTIISEEVGVNKPQPEIFRIALRLNGLKAEDAVMVGDSYSSDIAGAKAADIDQIWIHAGESDESATFIIPKLRDIMSIGGIITG